MSAPVNPTDPYTHSVGVGDMMANLSVVPPAALVSFDIVLNVNIAPLTVPAGSEHVNVATSASPDVRNSIVALPAPVSISASTASEMALRVLA